MINRRKFIGAVSGATIGRIVKPGDPSTAKPSLPGITSSSPTIPIGIDDESYWGRIRAEFRLDPQRAFFNTGTLGSCPRVVTETVTEAMRMIDEYPTFGYWARGMPSSISVLKKAAALLGADPPEVTITHSTTEGMNIIGLGLDLHPGDHVLISTHEHPGGEAVWTYLASRNGIQVNRFQPPLTPKNEEEILELIEREITPRTRLLVISHVLYSTGLVMPVKRIGEIARRRGLLFLVDGAHPVGMMPVNVKEIGCDFYAASGHKWLCGPRGTGLLYVRKERLSQLRQLVHAYREDHVPSDVKHFDAETSRLNFVWTNNLHDILGLGAAIEFHNQIGPSRVLAHNLELISRFKRAVVDIPGVELISSFEGVLASPMATVSIKGKSNRDVFKRLRDEHHITVKEVSDAELPVTLNSIRVSPHVYNTPAQIDALISAMRTVMTTPG